MEGEENLDSGAEHAAYAQALFKNTINSVYIHSIHSVYTISKSIL